VKEAHPERIRNLALISHQGAGKTTLAESLLFRTGAITRMGSIEEGTTQSDYHQDEIHRHISITTTLLVANHKGIKLNLLDAPGFMDFQGDVISSLKAADCAIVLINVTSGIEVGTDMVWGHAAVEQLPRFFFINHLDKEHVEFDKVAASLLENYDGAVVAGFPVNPGSEGFNQIVDLISMKVITYNPDGTEKSRTDPTGDLKARADEWRQKLVERAAEADDSLMENFFANDTLTQDELLQGLRKGLAQGTLNPILVGAGKRHVGTTVLLDFLTGVCPAPNERPAVKAKVEGTEKTVQLSCDANGHLAALVFKTISEQHVGDLSFFRVFNGSLITGSEVHNSNRGHAEKIGQIYSISGKNRKSVDEVQAGDIAALVKLKNTHTGDTLTDPKDGVVLPGITYPEPVTRTAVFPKTRGEEEKLAHGLHVLIEEDPSIKSHYDTELAQLIVEGQGELHLGILAEKLKERFGVDVDQVEPRIPYREAIKGQADGQGKYKKQTGGRGQFGDCWLKVESIPRDQAFEFVDAIVGGVIPGKFIPAIEKGIRATLVDGVVAGYPVVGVRCTVYDGSYHTVDSSENSFRIAASMGFKKIFKEAKPVVLEPIYDLEVRVPEEAMGDVMGDISSKRGKISGMDREGRFQLIRAKIPLAELHKYSSTLRSLSGGRGIHRQSFSHYEEVPGDIQAKLMTAYEERRAKGGAEDE